jgi:hypothetical protein
MINKLSYYRFLTLWSCFGGVLLILHLVAKTQGGTALKLQYISAFRDFWLILLLIGTFLSLAHKLSNAFFYFEQKCTSPPQHAPEPLISPPA